MNTRATNISLLFIFIIFNSITCAAAEFPHLKGQLTGILGSGVDYILRGEGWIKYKPTYLDFKLRVERKNNNNFQKYRLQFMPLKFGIAEFGISYRYLRKEDSEGVDGLGMAVRLKGENWKIPARYYPDLKLVHSKPMVRYRSIYADCQIIYYHERETGSLRPGLDWRVSQYFSVGAEARFYDDSDKNYIGLRLKIMAGY